MQTRAEIEAYWDGKLRQAEEHFCEMHAAPPSGLDTAMTIAMINLERFAKFKAHALAEFDAAARANGEALVDDLLGLGIKQERKRTDELLPDTGTGSSDGLADNRGGGAASGGNTGGGGSALDAALAKANEALAIANQRIAELEAQKPDTPPPTDPLGEELEKARRANKEWLGGDEAKQPIPEEIAALLDEGETFTHDVRRKLTERLNVELAELKNLRGLAGEDLKREAEIEKLLGLFARLGEI